ncbi:MAG: hypothetical protein AAGC73_00460 [Verrucomicrobiota bacterium]
MLRVAIVHYHLKRGGVTRVIESTLAGFARLPEPIKCIVLAGEVPADCVFAEQAVQVQGLHYSNTQASTPSPQTLLAKLREAATKALGGPPDIWHIHNHSLGKNQSMPGLVAQLAEDGEALLLHMHDFAEDGRPQNYLLNQSLTDHAQQLYPLGSRVHYAVLNGRDESIFTQPELAGDQLHQLPNAVDAEASTPDSSASQDILNQLQTERLFLYPVRALRRKNFGETILWSTLLESGDCLATTLAPTNQNYVAAYQRWIALSEKHHLPIHFGIGQSNQFAFEDLMQTAAAIVSTSITEGFGLAFLEPWLFGKSIIGRDLPAITADFKAKGIQLDTLYQALPIPKSLVDPSSLRTAIEKAMGTAYQAYGVPLPADAVDAAIDAISPSDDSYDFGGLNETLQEAVIDQIMQDVSIRESLKPIVQREPAESAMIETNATLIKTHYSPVTYAAQLAQIYHDILAAESGSIEYIDPQKILESFLVPENFRLLKT